MRNLLFISLTIILSSCSPRLISAPPSPQIAQSTDAPALVETPETQLGKILSLAIADLSARLSLDPNLIDVISAEPALWTSAALGCPQPGEKYTEQPVSGYQIWLEANGQNYIYHTDQAETIILCIEEDLPSIPVTPGEIDDGQPWMPVD